MGSKKDECEIPPPEEPDCPDDEPPKCTEEPPPQCPPQQKQQQQQPQCPPDQKQQQQLQQQQQQQQSQKQEGEAGVCQKEMAMMQLLAEQMKPAPIQINFKVGVPKCSGKDGGKDGGKEGAKDQQLPPCKDKKAGENKTSKDSGGKGTCDKKK